MNLNELEDEIFKARRVFEQHHDYISKIFFNNFPNGSCGPSADILAQYLSSKGIKDIEYVYGENNSKSHGWLEIEGLIIDITGDQFDDGVEGVYISTNRDFHDKFSPLKRNINPGVFGVLCDSYNKFKKLMDAHA
jgi:hypothetical protein